MGEIKEVIDFEFSRSIGGLRKTIYAIAIPVLLVFCTDINVSDFNIFGVKIFENKNVGVYWFIFVMLFVEIAYFSISALKEIELWKIKRSDKDSVEFRRLREEFMEAGGKYDDKENPYENMAKNIPKHEIDEQIEWSIQYSELVGSFNEIYKYNEKSRSKFFLYQKIKIYGVEFIFPLFIGGVALIMLGVEICKLYI